MSQDVDPLIRIVLYQVRSPSKFKVGGDRYTGTSSMNCNIIGI